MRRLAAVFALIVAAALPAPARAACRIIEVSFTPSFGLQLAVWLEDAAGNFIETALVTDMVATYGLANRPGIMEFNSEYRWPYGRREGALPIWAHRRGVTYPQIVFRDGYDRNLSHPLAQSSVEPRYCMPYLTGSPDWAEAVDAGTCASSLNVQPYTDKGRFEPDGGLSYYPPRNDLTPVAPFDSDDAFLYAGLNDLDAVSRATPPGNMPYTIRFAAPPGLPDGDYVVWVEASRERDPNAFHDYPSPIGIAFEEWGQPYRGQPSVVWQVPLVFDAANQVGITADYVGYGDPDGASGMMFDADGTITTDVEGSGAGRLLLASSPEGMYRVRATVTLVDDTTPPEAPGALAAADVTWNGANVRFVAPADINPDGDPVVIGYEIRYSAGEALTEANFAAAGTRVAEGLPVEQPGGTQQFALPTLNAETRYWVGVRALDACLNPGPLAVIDFMTGTPPRGEVDACFVATAAFGSPAFRTTTAGRSFERHVGALRRFRDEALRTQALGEIFIEAYYTFGPALAAVIEPSETLRAVTRDVIGTLVR